MYKKGSGKTGPRGEKGFYLVLALCAAVLGTSGYIAIKGAGTNTEEAAEEYVVQETAPVILPEEETVAVMAAAEEAAQTAEAPASVTVRYICPVEGSVQKPYSADALMYDSTMGDWRTHDGVDYACAEGTAVTAAADGTVTDVSGDGLLGTTVTIAHADGLESRYSNLTESVYVRTGDSVAQGQIIGTVGSTALSEAREAAHLHFALWENGEALDPGDYIG